MKKILFIAAASAVLLVSSCQKENVNLQNTQNQFTLKQTFNYSQTLTIYDETGKYSVDYIIQADDKKTFENGISSFKSMKMRLLYDNYVKTKNIPKNILNDNSRIPVLDYMNTLFIKVENVNKGTAKGFELIPGTELRNPYNVNGFHSFVWQLPTFANWYRITNTGSNGFTARDLYSNNSDCSNYVQSSQVTLSFYSQTHDFSSTNTVCRALWITSTTPMRSINSVVTIY